MSEIKKIDARGLSCPEPVVLTLKAITGGSDCLEVLVDTDTARENVLRLAQKKGYSASIAEEGSAFRLSLVRS